MKAIRKIIITACFLLLSTATAFADYPAFRGETLRYDIIYHWGIVWKHAGSATLSIHQTGNKYEAELTARSLSWVDKLFRVRDTLSCTISTRNGRLQPLRYRKASHEGKYNGIDIVEYSYSPKRSHAQCTRLRPGRAPQQATLETEGQAYDMLSIFYYLRTLDFKRMKKNTSVSSTVFSGRKKERIDICFIGVENIELRNKETRKAYHVVFTFTQDGRKKSSDDMHTWISIDKTHTPLMLKGKLPIGEVRCYLNK